MVSTSLLLTTKWDETSSASYCIPAPEATDMNHGDPAMCLRLADTSFVLKQFGVTYVRADVLNPDADGASLEV